MKPYAQTKYSKYQFTPKKPVKTFRDLDIYQQTMNCAVIVTKSIVPVLESFGQEDKGTKGKRKTSDAGESRHGDVKYPFLEGIIDCTMTVPLSIGEAHSIRFGDFTKGLALLEKAMSGCNKMIIYLEHIKGMYGDKVDTGILDEIIARYAEARTKTFHLELSWKKWGSAPRAITPAKIKL
jgi:hypothetical protein